VQRALGRFNLPKDALHLKLSFLVLVSAAILSEGLGTHATLGAFLAGVALGRIPEARKLAHESFYQTTAGIFATFYFVSIGMKANFVSSFDLPLTAFVLAVACAGKIGGVFLGARLGGKNPQEAILIAVAMNARGAVGIVLTTVALENGLIDQRIFVSLVIMALATTVIAALGIKRLMVRLPAQPDQLSELAEIR
jgi:Kef-type K+ transport system membrane component KefB